LQRRHALYCNTGQGNGKVKHRYIFTCAQFSLVLMRWICMSDTPYFSAIYLSVFFSFRSFFIAFTFLISSFSSFFVGFSLRLFIAAFTLGFFLLCADTSSWVAHLRLLYLLFS